jgi:hypothetical protein
MVETALMYFAIGFWAATGVFGAVVFWVSFFYLVTSLLGIIPKKEQQ